MPRLNKTAKKNTDSSSSPVSHQNKVLKDPAAILASFDFFDDEDDVCDEVSKSPPSPDKSIHDKVVEDKRLQAQKRTAGKPAAQARAKKREAAEADLVDDEDESATYNGPCGDFKSEMQKMLEGFGADLNKTVNSKRKRLEQFTTATIKSSNRKVEEIWRGQQASRQKLTEEYCKQVACVFSQWETDLAKCRDQEEKLQGLMKQQQKLAQQTQVIQNQRLKTIRQLHEEYNKNLLELEQVHQEQQATIQTELKKEMALLQKRILMDTQQQEMATVRKSLQSMLF